jgi:hypothetical protein
MRGGAATGRRVGGDAAVPIAANKERGKPEL